MIELGIYTEFDLPCSKLIVIMDMETGLGTYIGNEYAIHYNERVELRKEVFTPLSKFGVDVVVETLITHLGRFVITTKSSRPSTVTYEKNGKIRPWQEPLDAQHNPLLTRQFTDPKFIEYLERLSTQWNVC